MIKPFTCLCLAAAFGSGLYLYSEKHRTAMLDREIGHVVRDTQAARDHTNLLRAEWALLNEPQRLGQMAGRYLKLTSIAPGQFVQLANLASRLPAPIAAGAAGTTDEDDVTAPAGSTGAIVAAVTAATAPADTGKSAADAVATAVGLPVASGVGTSSDVIVPMASNAPAQAASPLLAQHGQGGKTGNRSLAHLDARGKPARHVALADRTDPLMQRSTPLPLAAPQPMGASVFSAMARPMRPASPRATIVSAMPAYAAATPYGGATYVGTSLGGRSSLPPPVPYGTASR